MKEIEFGVDLERLMDELTNIRLFIEKESESKQQLLQESRKEISMLKNELIEKNDLILSLEKNVKDGKSSQEANQQIINKLLSDISKMQNDIDWYRRTYEKRSFMGYLKERLKRKS
jgi:septal ring factor EnvC (AmiA/AmiB activator)